MEVRSWPWNAREARVSKTFQAPGAWVAAETGALLAGAGGVASLLVFSQGKTPAGIMLFFILCYFYFLPLFFKKAI